MLNLKPIWKTIFEQSKNNEEGMTVAQKIEAIRDVVGF